ncbi:PRC-barrel domain-containing protein [Marivita sp. GX14005]|uniref:PRC-barrel domain-containing protein n=1 Tax=Marivita sp. GX14005 TaxID=2942276 RepID=UPI00201898B2|nr:PRC-barrel domain-containing protein [Marivita sp. GX14005]MCL3881244.1 PRC-barrel domain-containing protein [Marivita sp. GX14005]
MTKLFASALALTVASTGAWAQDTMAMEIGERSMAMSEMRGDLIRTRDITGGNIYTMNEADDEGWDPDMRYDAVGTNWNEIGEIEDIILSRDGQMIGIVGEVGGFLDIADKHVMIAVEDVSLVPVDDKTYAFVTPLSEEQLEELPEVDEGFWD